MSSPDVIARLFATIESRKHASAQTSYTAQLFKAGPKKIADKILEEAEETVAEILKQDKKRLAAESADLVYHLLVAWAEAGITPADVWAVLEDRVGVSGIEEKASRNKSK